MGFTCQSGVALSARMSIFQCLRTLVAEPIWLKNRLYLANVTMPLILPDNIVLLPLPPYAPELNVTENIWQYLRGDCLSHCVWDTYEAIVDACCDAWNTLMATPDVIASIGTREWAQVRI